MYGSPHFPSGDWSKALYKQKTTSTDIGRLQNILQFHPTVHGVEWKNTGGSGEFAVTAGR